MNPPYAPPQQQQFLGPINQTQQQGGLNLNQSPLVMRPAGAISNGNHTAASSGNVTDHNNIQNRTSATMHPPGIGQPHPGPNINTEHLSSQMTAMNVSGPYLSSGQIKSGPPASIGNINNGEPSPYYPSGGTNINHMPPHMPPALNKVFPVESQLPQRPPSINGDNVNNSAMSNRSTPSQNPQGQLVNQHRHMPYTGQLISGHPPVQVHPNSGHISSQQDLYSTQSIKQPMPGQNQPQPGQQLLAGLPTQQGFVHSPLHTQMGKGIPNLTRDNQVPHGSGQPVMQHPHPGQLSSQHQTRQLVHQSDQPMIPPGQLSHQRNQLPGHQQGQFHQMHSPLPPMPSQMPPMSGQMTHPSNLMHQMSGQMPPIQGQMSQIPGQINPMSSQMPPAPGHMPPMANQIPPMPVQLPYSPMAVPYQQQSGYPQPQQAKKLDPDQMPSPIQVTNEDQMNRSGIFCTNQKGLVPPLVTTVFITQDQGNAGPRYMRSSMYNVPITIDMMKQTSVPFGVVISPLARLSNDEVSPPIVNLGELGPVRCNRCKAYMCPFMQFIDSGRRFQCLLCKATTEVPAEYFQHLDHTGQRLDRFERPELMLGTYEFVATKDYCRNNIYPKAPAVIFVIDVSYNNIKSGLVHLLCSEMKNIIRNLPGDNGAKSNMKVGFITYNNTVHFYNIKGNLAQPQMLVVGDIQEMFMPLLDGFLCNPDESEAVIDSLMQQIPTMFSDTRETETILAPAIQAGLEALKASECAGKLLVFHSSLPIADAPGKLKNRDDRKLLGTDKEKTVLTAQCTSYNNLGQDCVGAGCSVDLFLFNNSYIDIATIGQVSRLTGGEIFKYTYFQADLDGERLIKDVLNDISRPIAFDSIMRVRTSTGVRPTDFYGHFFMSNTTDMELASIDCDKAIAIEIKHDDKLTEEEGVYLQVALLYTSCGGQRRLRIHNLSLKTCSQMADLYRSCDLDTIINFFSKQAMFKMIESSPKTYKDALINRCAQMLACYRKNCASPSSAGQLILPECMKLLPLYVNCLLKSDAVSGGSDMTVDDRSFVMQAVCIMDLPSSVSFFYPRLISLHDVDPSETDVPAPIRCSMDKMTDEGAFLLENGIHMFLWIGLNLSPEWIQSVFGVASAVQVDTDKAKLPLLENQLSFRIRSIIQSVSKQRHHCMRLTLVRQREKLEPVFKHFLVEDRGTDGSPSYVDFLCHMHKEIRMLLS